MFFFPHSGVKVQRLHCDVYVASTPRNKSVWFARWLCFQHFWEFGFFYFLTLAEIILNCHVLTAPHLATSSPWRPTAQRSCSWTLPTSLLLVVFHFIVTMWQVSIISCHHSALLIDWALAVLLKKRGHLSGKKGCCETLVLINLVWSRLECFGFSCWGPANVCFFLLLA